MPCLIGYRLAIGWLKGAFGDPKKARLSPNWKERNVDPVAYIVISAIFMFACGVAGATLAGAKNRDVSFWAAWTFLLPPTLLILVLLRANKGPRPRRPSLDEEDRLHP